MEDHTQGIGSSTEMYIPRTANCFVKFGAIFRLFQFFVCYIC